MSIIPFPTRRKAKVLVAGAGGGYDFLCGLPIVLELETMGCEVIIANYSFTNLNDVKNADWHNDRLLEINADSFLSASGYFPELLLSQWYQSKGVIVVFDDKTVAAKFCDKTSPGEQMDRVGKERLFT